MEIWGCLQVLRATGMPAFVQQQRVAVGGELFVLDTYDGVGLAVEMDATVGWQTLRFSFGRLTGAADACRRDVLADDRARRALFAADGVR